MANAKVCDRCSIVMAEPTFEEMKTRKYVIAKRTNDPRHDSHETIDLCPTCYGLLEEFMYEDLNEE